MRIPRNTLPLLFTGIVNKIVSKNYADIVELEALRRIHGAHLLHARIIRRPLPERVLLFPGHCEITDPPIISEGVENILNCIRTSNAKFSESVILRTLSSHCKYASEPEQRN